MCPPHRGVTATQAGAESRSCPRSGSGPAVAAMEQSRVLMTFLRQDLSVKLQHIAILAVLLRFIITVPVKLEAWEHLP